MYTSASRSAIAEQQLMFSVSDYLPATLPDHRDLLPAENLASTFNEIHNYIYANEGLLKDKIFHEVARLLALKLHDEAPSSDRALRFGITSAEYALLLQNADSPFVQRLELLQAEASSRYPKMPLDQPFSLKPLTLGNAVAKLQFISLNRTPRDAKGEAFQAFIYRHHRGARGEFFTPLPIVGLAVSLLSPTPSDHVIDPACGSGGFLVDVVSQVAKSHPELDQSSYISRNLRGIEFNPDVALAAALRLAFEGASGEEILCANSLLETPDLDGSFDLVLTNPPFGSKGKIEDQTILRHYELARRWKATSSTRWEPTSTVLPGQTPEILFIEKCIRLLKPGGRLAIVLPEGILQNSSYAYVRSWIRRVASPIAVVGIPQEAFVPYGTGIKTSLLVVRKGHRSSPVNVFMARIHKIGYDVKGQPTFRSTNDTPLAKDPRERVVDEDVTAIAQAFNGPSEISNHDPNLDIFQVPVSDLNSRLDVDHYRPDDQHMLTRLTETGSVPLSSIAQILQEAEPFRSDGTDEIRYFAISDVDADSMVVTSTHFMHPSEAPSRATYRVREGDIVTAISGASTGTPRQATAIITHEQDGAICSNGFAVLRSLEGVDAYYLMAYMRSQVFLSQVRRLMTGHAIPAISPSELGRVLVPIPSESEQRTIALAMKAGIQARVQAASLVQEALSTTDRFLRDLRP